MTLTMNAHSGLYREAGSTLIVALVMLLLISLIAVGSMEGTILQERMASNTEDRALAFESAEAALRNGEGAVLAGAGGGCWIGDTTCNGTIDSPEWRDGDWSAVTSQPVPRLNPRSAGAPAFHLNEIEECPVRKFPCPFRVFNVTARGVGGRATTVVVLRSKVLQMQ